jgi:urease accessory protein
LSEEFGARRPARESRDAAFKMGQRFSRLINSVTGRPLLEDGLCYPVAFGAAARHFQIDEVDAARAYLRQSIAGLISACQRLLPVGQVAAARSQFQLKAAIEQAAASGGAGPVSCFTPLPELASMRHTLLESRLFIS